MNVEKLRELWKQEEAQAHICGWDFSHIGGRYEEEGDLPWNFRSVVQSYREDSLELLDMDTGGGEFLLSLGHPYGHTAATEGYPPNVELCKRTLCPLGIKFRAAADVSKLPFEDGQFDLIINRHGDFCIPELLRLLKPGGLFLTQQVGEDNDRELVELLLPGTPKPFRGLTLAEQRSAFRQAGFEVLQGEECFRPIRFYDVGALVWFARIIQWEFPNFSVDGCFDQLLEAQRIMEEQGAVTGTIHRYLIVAQKV